VAKANRANKNYTWAEPVVLSSVSLWSVNGNRNRRHSKIRRTLVRMMRPKRHFRFRSAR
jgi:hypothetical protein